MCVLVYFSAFLCLRSLYILSSFVGRLSPQGSCIGFVRLGDGVSVMHELFRHAMMGFLCIEGMGVAACVVFTKPGILGVVLRVSVI